VGVNRRLWREIIMQLVTTFQQASEIIIILAQQTNIIKYLIGPSKGCTSNHKEKKSYNGM